MYEDPNDFMFVQPKPHRYLIGLSITVAIAIVVTKFLKNMDVGLIIRLIAIVAIVSVGYFISDVWVNGDGPED